MGRVMENCSCGHSMESSVPDGQEPIVTANWLAAHVGHQRLNPNGDPIDAKGKILPRTVQTTVPEAAVHAQAALTGSVVAKEAANTGVLPAAPPVAPPVTPPPAPVVAPVDPAPPVGKTKKASK